MDSNEIVESSEESVAEIVKAAAASRVTNAFETIDAIMESPKTPASVRLKAAEGILEQAAGRVETRTVAHEAGGLNITILNLSGGTKDFTQTMVSEAVIDITQGSKNLDTADVLAAFAGKQEE